MVSLLDIRTAVSDEINRGTQLDSKIDKRVNMFVRWVERNHNLQYMFRYVTFTLPAGERDVGWPSRPKRVKFLRYLDSNSEWFVVNKVEPEDVLKNETANPTAFWFDGFDNIWFDNAPESALPLELSYWQYSDTISGDATTHWLFDNAEDLMLYGTMVYMASVAKQQEWVATYKPLRDEALRTLLLAEDELIAGAQSPIMHYNGDF